MAEGVIIQSGPLQQIVAEIFSAAGCSAAEGQRIGKYLVDANLVGHDSHGVIRVSRYLSWMKSGSLNADQSIEIITDTPTLAVVDGNFGFGQSIGEQAVDLGIDKAKAGGVSIIGLRNSGHLGRVGDWAERAAEANQVSIHFVNTVGLGLLVAPFGSVDRRMSTNPFVIGVPVAGRPPLILDFATSIVAEGKILVAINGGKPIPEGSLVGPDGEYTTNAEVIYGPFESGKVIDSRAGGGAIRAMGEHKGSGLSIMCEILAGAITGNQAAHPDGKKIGNNMLSIFLDVGAIEAGSPVGGEVQRYVDWVKSARAIDPDGEVLLPGEPERNNRTKRSADGIPLTDQVWQALVEAAEEVGIGGNRIEALRAGTA